MSWIDVSLWTILVALFIGLLWKGPTPGTRAHEITDLVFLGVFMITLGKGRRVRAAFAVAAGAIVLVGLRWLSGQIGHGGSH
jgi:hypothetical protein